MKSGLDELGRDSVGMSSTIRDLVLPERPPGTEGLDEAQLAALVTRDAMIGVAKVQPPEGRAA